MGRIAKILQFARAVRNDLTNSKVTDVTINPGGGANETAEHFADSGDDSHPLTTDYAVVVDVPSDRVVTVGYADTQNTPKALAGDKRIYSRDANTGAMVAEVWLKSDGTIIGVNQNGQFELEPSGNFVINGLTIDINGNLTTSGTIQGDTVDALSSLLASGKEIVAHKHSQANDSGGDMQQNTSANI